VVRTRHRFGENPELSTTTAPLQGMAMQKDRARLDRRRAERFVGHSTVGLIILVLGATTLAVALGALGSPLLDLDQQLAAWLNSMVSGNPLLVSSLKLATSLGGSPASWVVLSTLAAVLLIRRQWRLACFVAVTGLGAAILSPAVKELVGRLRPMVETPVASAPGYSFPSGHALGSLVTYGVLLLVFLPVLPRHIRRPVTATIAVLVVLIGFTRLALGVHFLSDVIAGWLLGVGWLAVTTVAFRTWRRSAGLPTDAPGLAPEASPALEPAPAAEKPVLPQPRRRAAELLVAWVLLLGVLLGAGWLVSRGLAGTVVARLDSTAVQWLAQHRSATWTRLAQPAGALGSTAVVSTFTAVTAVLLLAVTRRWRPMLFLIVGMAGEATLFLATASIIDRSRPPVPHLGPDLPTTSFPSGHVAAALTCYGAVTVLVFTGTRAWWRWFVLAAAVLAVSSVALSRIYYGVHYPSDVLGSALLAGSWLLVTWYLLRPD
jgi:undecaprenyl-diphosphatase